MHRQYFFLDQKKILARSARSPSSAGVGSSPLNMFRRSVDTFDFFNDFFWGHDFFLGGDFGLVVADF